MYLRARYILPITSRPVENGVVAISDNRIASVERWPAKKPASSTGTVDLGDCILMPGLINAHCHLDYTDLAGKISPPRAFPDFIKAIVALKAAMSLDDFACSWQRGAEMMLRTGATTIADIEAVPELLPRMWSTTPLRVLSYREIICLQSGAPAHKAIDSTVTELEQYGATDGRVGLSPHSPYSTTADLLQQAAKVALKNQWRLTTHLAESEQEFEMFMYRQGPLYDWLRSQRDMSDCGHGSPVQHLAQCGYLSNRLLAAHANYLGRDDASVLGRQGVSVVHCPRSHKYFRHLSFPRKELRREGVNICLGTDSLASAIQPKNAPLELDLFAEMRALASNDPDLSSPTILRMATFNAAKALGRERQIGQLAPGALADIIAIPLHGQVTNLYDCAVHHGGPLRGVMINGKWILPPQTGLQTPSIPDGYLENPAP